MMRKRVKRASAILVALALVFTALTLPGAKAANAVDTTRKCSVEFSIDTSVYDELDDINILIQLYKVASISESGVYTATDGFESLDLTSIDSETTAAEWLDTADEAAKLITKDTVAVAETETIGGKAKVNNLDTGLYLVSAVTTQSDYFEYSFKPYLVSLPNNYYYTTGNDDWVYDLTGSNAIGLKPEQTERFGDLKLTKFLENQNVTIDEKATFVFEVAYTTPKGVTKTEFVTLTFDEFGDKTVTIKDIPAGSKVTVKEVYSGSSYELISDPEVSAVIIADDVVGVSFINKHNGKPSGGYGVVNNYKPDENGQYQWRQLKDSTDTK